MSDTSSDISLADFLETCQTGDILLYNSQYWYSRLIEWGSGSKFSHISIILRDPTFINENLNGLYILESSYEDIPDSNTGEKYGVFKLYHCNMFLMNIRKAMWVIYITEDLKQKKMNRFTIN